jgi:glycogen synthase
MDTPSDVAAPVASAWFRRARRRTAQQAKTRILLLTNSHDIGGMEEHVELLARYLDRQQFEVYGICPDWPAVAPFHESLAAEADHAVALSTSRPHGLWSRLTEAIRFYRQIRGWRIQVMHMHSGYFDGHLSVLPIARLAGVRKIFVTEHLAPEAPLARRDRWVRNVFSWMVDGIVCVSLKNFEARRRFIYTPPKRTMVVNNGIDLDDFEPIADETLAALRKRHNIPAGVPIVGTVVRFEPYKGLHYLIDAMPAIRAACPEAVLLLVGDGPMRAELEVQVKQLGLTDHVYFVGFQDNPRPYMALMDAFVLPVPVGSMSIALLEAMAMERACVITFGGDGEAIIHGENGYCAEPRNPQSIAQNVLHILVDPAVKERIGKAARKRVEAEFSARQVARSLGDFYTRIR